MNTLEKALFAIKMLGILGATVAVAVHHTLVIAFLVTTLAACLLQIALELIFELWRKGPR